MRTYLPMVGLLACVVILGGAGDVKGQVPNNSPNFVRPQLPQQQNYVHRPQPNLQQPTTSPYLGLLRRGTPMGLNYFSLVRPEIEMRDALTRQQAEQDRLAQQTRLLQQQQNRMIIDPSTQPGANPMTGASRTMPPTGHPTSLMNLQGRFMTR